MQISKARCVATAILAALSFSAGAQELPELFRPVTLTHPGWRGIQLEFIAKLENSASVSAVRIQGGVSTGTDRAHRFIFDASEKRYFGYDLDIQPAGDFGLRIHITPLTMDVQELARIGVDSTWTRLGPVRYPVISQVQPGDTISIDLLINRSTGQKIVDFITLKQSAYHSPVNTVSAPRDFTVADAMLQILGPTLTANGKPVGSVAQGGVSAAVVWVYVPGRGRYVLSLVANPQLGFRKAGKISTNALSFADEGVTYQLECPGRIVPGEGLFNLYVLRDASWRPQGSEITSGLLLGGADEARLVVHK